MTNTLAYSSKVLIMHETLVRRHDIPHNDISSSVNILCVACLYCVVLLSVIMLSVIAPNFGPYKNSFLFTKKFVIAEGFIGLIGPSYNLQLPYASQAQTVR
jgi:hypothetical protein